MMMLAQGGSSLISSLMGSSAASTASQQQVAAQMQGIQSLQGMFGTAQQGLQPYIGGGQDALSSLLSSLGIGGGQSLLSGSPTAETNFNQFTVDPNTAAGSATFKPTAAQLAQFPGYQFALDQGTKATTNAFTAQGLGGTGGGGSLGPSGAEGKGLANYAEGLASTTEQTAYNQWLGQNNQAFTQNLGAAVQGQSANSQQFNQWLSTVLPQISGMQGAANTGAGAGGSLASAAGTAGGNIANMFTGVGNAQAAGTLGSAQSLMAGIGGAGSSISQAMLLQALGLGGTSGNGLSQYEGNYNTAANPSLAQ